MARTTISTGDITIHQGKPHAPGESQPCHVLILGDFSGRHDGDCTPIARRKILEVDCDNFEKLFTRMDVSLRLPLAAEPISFREFDELHPDTIYEHVPLFEQFRSLKRRLDDPATFAEAAAEIGGDTRSSTKLQTAAESLPADGELLEMLLSGSSEQSSVQDSGDMRSLIRQIAGAYVVPRADPRLDEMLAAVDESTSQLMRRILHANAFQALESSWRGLDFLIRRLETGSALKLFVLDLSLDEIIALGTGEPNPLHKLLVEQRRGTGAIDFGLILGNYRFADQPGHTDAVSTLAHIAAELGATFVAGGSERLAGCAALHAQPDCADWSLQLDAAFSAQWQQLRADPATRHVALVAPRFLLRLPYGKRTRPINRFPFEELPERGAHDFYLWANGGWLVMLLLADAWARHGVATADPIAEIGELPMHVRQVDDETEVTPCAEVFLTDTTAAALQRAGLMVIRSVLNRDCVRVSGFRSLHESDTALKGAWTRA